MTDEELTRLRTAIYMWIMNSIEFEECTHKLIKMNLPKQHLSEICNMVLDCCLEDWTYTNFYGLIGERLCKVWEDFLKSYFQIFVERYSTIFEYDSNKIRKMAKFFGHLLFTDALDWSVFRCVELTE